MGSFAFLELFLAERSASRGKDPSPTSRTPTSTYFPYFPRTGAPPATARQSVDQKVLGGLTVDFSTPVSGTPHLAKIFA